MTPVRPIPPTVAQNSSGRTSGDVSTIDPSASSSRSRSTLEPNEPSTWWFLPWMSLAMAPPTVTKRVPGDTGTNRPRGTITRSSSSRLTPAGTVAVAAVRVDDGLVGVLAQPQHGAAAVLRGVAVGATQPAGDAAAPRQLLDGDHRRVGAPDLDHLGGRRRGAAPPGEQRAFGGHRRASLPTGCPPAQYGHSGSARPRRRASLPQPSVRTTLRPRLRTNHGS